MSLNPDIEQARKNHIAWWNRKGMVLDLTAPKSGAEPKDVLDVPTDVKSKWTDLRARCEGAAYSMAKTAYFADALPLLLTTFVPLIEAVGPDGLFITCNAPDEATARKLVEQVQQYR
jgi:hypothetical protein